MTFIRSINNRPELFFLEQSIKKGYLIADLKLNFDEFGALKEDYIVNGLLRDGKINLFKRNQLEKINFLFNITGNNLNFKDISVINNKLGKPSFVVNNKIKNIIKKQFKVSSVNFFLSISDEKKYSIAYVILQKK